MRDQTDGPNKAFVLHVLNLSSDRVAGKLVMYRAQP